MFKSRWLYEFSKRPFSHPAHLNSKSNVTPSTMSLLMARYSLLPFFTRRNQILGEMAHSRSWGRKVSLENHAQNKEVVKDQWSHVQSLRTKLERVRSVKLMTIWVSNTNCFNLWRYIDFIKLIYEKHLKGRKQKTSTITVEGSYHINSKICVRKKK